MALRVPKWLRDLFDSPAKRTEGLAPAGLWIDPFASSNPVSKADYIASGQGHYLWIVLPGGETTATIGLTGVRDVIACQSAFVPPSFTAEFALSGAKDLVGAVATHVPPSFSAAVALQGVADQIAAAAEWRALSDFQATIALSGAKDTVSSAASHVPPSFAATVALVGAQDQIAAPVVHVAPGAAAAIALTGLADQLGVAASHVPPSFSAAVALTGVKDQVAVAAAFSGASVTVSDNFNRSNGALGANWTVLPSGMTVPTINTNQVIGAGGMKCGAYWSANALAANQWAEMKCTNAYYSTAYPFDGCGLGPAVRCQSGQPSGYFLGYFDWDDMGGGLGGIVSLGYLDYGIYHAIHQWEMGAGWGNNKVLRLEVSGTTLTAKWGTAHGGSFTTLGSYTDSRYATGYAGIIGQGASYGDDWYAGEL